MSPPSWRSVLGVGLLVVGISAAAYPVVIAPLMNPSERDEAIKDPRLEAGFQVPRVCIDLAFGARPGSFLQRPSSLLIAHVYIQVVQKKSMWKEIDRQVKDQRQ